MTKTEIIIHLNKIQTLVDDEKENMIDDLINELMNDLESDEINSKMKKWYKEE